MYCTKCRYTSFDHLPVCPKCGFDWQDAREALQLSWLQSVGHDWFEHARQNGQAVPEKEAPSVEGPDFDLAADDMDEHVSPGLHRDADDQDPLLDEELDFEGLVRESAAEMVDAVPEHAAMIDDQNQAEGDRIQPEVQLPVVETGSGPAMEVLPGEEQASGFSAEKDRISSDDVLAAWEIPDHMVPKGEDDDVAELVHEPSEMEAPGHGPDTNREAADGDIVYDFSAFEEESEQAGQNAASKPEPDNTSDSEQVSAPRTGDRT